MPPRILCIGGAVIDRTFHAAAPLVRDTSNPAHVTTGFGGVARNVAEVLARLGAEVARASRIGNDAHGERLMQHLNDLHIDCSLSARDPHQPTAEYVAVLEPDGTLAYGLAAMQIFDGFDDAFVDRIAAAMHGVDWLFCDCNLPAPALQRLIGEAGARGCKLAVDAVSLAKAKRLPARLDGISCLFANRDEARLLTGQEGEAGLAAALVARGADGVSIADGAGEMALTASPVNIVDVTGAGDSLTGGTLYALAGGAALAPAATFGIKLAGMTAGCGESVHPDISPELAKTHVSIPVRR